jgi:Flavodoxin
MIVRVVVASRHGATREIADAIADELRKAGHDPRVEDAAAVERLGAGEPTVLGSALYMGRWLKPARELLGQLAAKPGQQAVWLFSSGPTGNPPKPDGPEPAEVVKAAQLLKAVDHAVFAGRLQRESLKLAERMTVRAVHAADGDFRDWTVIRSWAQSIAKALDHQRQATTNLTRAPMEACSCTAKSSLPLTEAMALKQRSAKPSR